MTDPNLDPSNLHIRESGDGQEVIEGNLPAVPVAISPSVPDDRQISGQQQPSSGGGKNSAVTNPAARNWLANEQLMNDIENLGFSKIVAEKALFYTGNRSADVAVGWILDHPEAQDDKTPLDLEGYSGGSSSSSGSSPDEPYAGLSGMAYKMIFVVNSSLKMGLGKIAAQVAHATLGLYRELTTRQSQALSDWTELGETKVVLRGEDSDQLLQLQQRARLAGLHSYLVQDAGRTQIAAGSMTVLSVFGPSEKVDEVTGQLKLM